MSSEAQPSGFGLVSCWGRVVHVTNKLECVVEFR